MKVKELIKRLQELDPQADVYMTHNYRDIGNTTVAISPWSVEAGLVSHWAYGNCMQVVEPDCADDETGPEGPAEEVVLLKHCNY